MPEGARARGHKKDMAGWPILSLLLTLFNPTTVARFAVAFSRHGPADAPVAFCQIDRGDRSAGLLFQPLTVQSISSPI